MLGGRGAQWGAVGLRLPGESPGPAPPPPPGDLSSWGPTDSRPPPAPEPGAGSSPGLPAPPPPPGLGRHLLIDGNGVPYVYTVRVDEEPRRAQPEPPRGAAAGGGYSCPQCLQVFKSPLYLKRHGVSHSDLRPYACGVCAKTFKRSSSLCQHRLTHRPRGSQPHACPLCPRRFQDARELARHIRGH